VGVSDVLIPRWGLVVSRSFQCYNSFGWKRHLQKSVAVISRRFWPRTGWEKKPRRDLADPLSSGKQPEVTSMLSLMRIVVIIDQRALVELRRSWSCWDRSWRRARKRDRSSSWLSISLKQRYTVHYLLHEKEKFFIFKTYIH